MQYTHFGGTDDPRSCGPPTAKHAKIALGEQRRLQAVVPLVPAAGGQKASAPQAREIAWLHLQLSSVHFLRHMFQKRNRKTLSRRCILFISPFFWLLFRGPHATEHLSDTVHSTLHSTLHRLHLSDVSMHKFPPSPAQY